MLIKGFEVGQLSTNCYIVTDEKSLQCAIIDPGAESGRILNYISENNLKPVCIFLTHGHFDHTTAVASIRAELDIPAYINKRDVNEAGAQGGMKYTLTPGEALWYYKDGDVIEVGSLSFHVMETPGHSEGSVTLRCEDALFTGDTLFRDSCGRTDFDGGSMETLLSSLKKLYSLEGDYEVYPGHADATTLDRERRFNYYMRRAVEG
jgi:glyoxylase-like metal-dependent hydrolase (beta-lactamase superfamily II)